MSHIRNPDVEYRPAHPELKSVTVGVFVSCGCGWYAEIDPNPNNWDDAALRSYFEREGGEAWMEHLRGIDAGQDQ